MEIKLRHECLFISWEEQPRVTENAYRHIHMYTYNFYLHFSSCLLNIQNYFGKTANEKII